MEAKDTVMSLEEIGKKMGDTRPPHPRDRAIAQAQAEISFKAGMKEVVGWLGARRLKGVDSFSKTVLFQGDMEIRGKDLQAKLKEWDL